MHVCVCVSVSVHVRSQAEFEKNDSSASFEGKYQKLISDISTIYKGAKEHHAAGIALLIKEFNYHASFKRWVRVWLQP